MGEVTTVGYIFAFETLNKVNNVYSGTIDMLILKK